jgi:hypothetical protein
MKFCITAAKEFKIFFEKDCNTKYNSIQIQSSCQETSSLVQSRQQRMRYIPRKKLGLVAAVRRLMEEEGLSQNKAAACITLFLSLITRWVKQQSALLDAAKKPKLSSHPGPDSQLHDIKDSLPQFIFEN